MIIMKIQFPNLLSVKQALGKKNIPCVCKIKENVEFVIKFNSPLFDAEGKVKKWDQNMVNESIKGSEYLKRK
jgi:hypothetical protein